MDFLRQLWMTAMDSPERLAHDWEDMAERMSAQEIAVLMIEMDYEGAWSGQASVCGLSDDDYERLCVIRDGDA